MKNSIFFLGLMMAFLACKAPLIQNNKKILALPSSWDTPQVNGKMNTPFSLLGEDKQLVALIDTALRRNFDVQEAIQRLEMVKSNTLMIKGLLSPKVEWGTSSSLRKFGLYTMDGSGNATTEITPGELVPTHLPDFISGIQASWELDIFHKLRNKNNAAFQRALASNEGLKWVKTNLVSEVAASYYSLLSMDEEIALVDSFITIQQHALSVVEFQKEVGATNKLAVKQFEARLFELKGLKKELDQASFEMENQLNFLLGRYPHKIERNKQWMSAYFVDSLQVGIPAETLQNRPDIKEAEYELLANKFDVQVARAAFYPSLNLSSNVGLQAFRLDYLAMLPQSIAYGIAGGLVGPLLNKSAIKAEFNFANAQQVASLYAYQKILMQGYYEVANQISLASKLQETFQLRQAEVSSLSEAIDASIDLFKSNRANYLELLLIQQNTLQSKIELINLRRRQYLAMIQIYRSLGGGWQ
jgi:NodT family efflux transporter outer membrane factor (OMF) lipoprotein